MESRLAHTDSYYAASASSNDDRPPLKGQRTCDVCIVGAGYTGLSAGLFLAEAGYKVIILEAAKVGWGASGRNGGQLINGYNRGFETIRSRYGEDTARAMISMAFEGSHIIRDRVSKYNIKCDLKNTGSFVAAFTSKQQKGLEHEQRVWEGIGHNELVLVNSDNIKEIVNTNIYYGGLLDKKGGHLHALNMALGQALAIESLGGKIYEQSQVVAVERKGQPEVRTQFGSVKSGFIILCGNAYLGKVVPELASKIMPISSQVITTERLGEELANQLMPSDSCVEDSNYFLDYYRMTADKRLLFGGGIIYSNTDPANIEQRLRPHMLKVFPSLSLKKIEHAWSGSIAITFKRLPHVGRLTEKIYFAHGYSGHGVTTAHLIGKILSEAINQQVTRYDIFAAMKHSSFPGGQMFRIPLTALGAWYYSMKDKLGV